MKHKKLLYIVSLCSLLLGNLALSKKTELQVEMMDINSSTHEPLWYQSSGIKHALAMVALTGVSLTTSRLATQFAPSLTARISQYIQQIPIISRTCGWIAKRTPRTIKTILPHAIIGSIGSYVVMKMSQLAVQRERRVKDILTSKNAMVKEEDITAGLYSSVLKGYVNILKKDPTFQENKEVQTLCNDILALLQEGNLSQTPSIEDARNRFIETPLSQIMEGLESFKTAIESNIKQNVLYI